MELLWMGLMVFAFLCVSFLLVKCVGFLLVIGLVKVRLFVSHFQ